MVAQSPSTVLVVDDDEGIRDYLAEVLRFEGYKCQCFSESLSALAYLAEENRPADLVLADIRMPGMNGIDLLREVKSRQPELPVILISGLYELALALDALKAGADDYLKKPVKPSDVVTLVGKYLQRDARHHEQEFREALRQFLDGRSANGEGTEALVEVFRMLGFRRYETFQHSKRVAAYSRLFGEHCGLTEPELGHLELGALLHDIGKIGIPRNVLLKPEPLTGAEWRVMKTRPQVGYGLLSEFSAFREEAQIVLSHHERFDGKGYPRGKSGKEIPVGARIFSIVDTLDAITSDRPYRAAQPLSKACEQIEKMSGSQFDPVLVDVFGRLPLEELRKVRREYPDEVS